MMIQPPEIYFLHIPKTAGSSLASLIRCAYPQEQGIPVYEWQQLVCMSREEINRYRCYTGHFGTSLYSLLDHPVPTVTLLRDPFERVVSQIRHTTRFRRQQGIWRMYTWRAYLSRWEQETQPGLRKWLEARFVSPCLQDFQTRSLGVDIDLAPYMGTVDTRDYGYLLLETQKGQSMEVILERAKQRLDSMVVVGTVERFADSVELICAFLDIPVPETLPQENVAQGHSISLRYRDSGEISTRLAARIDEITAYDRELYAYANRLLDKQLAQLSRDEGLR